ncbi:MAG TPA: endospore germination permease [Bacillota bacterium]|nr:endospore germination permease [Bacillota bacterium]
MNLSNHLPIISSRQLGLILISIRVAVMTVFLPTAWSTPDPKNAWLSAILSGIGGMIITYLFVVLSRKYPDQTLIQIFETIFGKWLGALFSIIYLYFFLNIASVIVREFAEVLNTALMPETPVSIFIVYVMVAVIFAVFRGLEAIIRTNAITLPISLISLVVILCLLVKTYHPELILPILEDGIKPVVRGSLVPLSLFGEVILLPMLYPYVQDKENVLRYSMLAQIISIFILLGLILAIISTFGAEEAKNLTLPVFSLVRMISIANFFERVEAIMVAIWISLLYTKMCIYLYVTVIGTAQLFRLKNVKCLIFPLGITVLILANKDFKNLSDLKYYTMKEWNPISLLIEYIIPCFLVVVSYFSRRKRLT